VNQHIILFDLEYTAWEGSRARSWSEPWEHREIIQVAAIRVALTGELPEIGSFDRLVRPKCNPQLSDYIITLTGIDQKEIDTLGLPFSEAFSLFFSFCEQGSLPLYCYGDDLAIFVENFAIHAVKPATFTAGMYDIRALFEQAGIDTSRYTSGTVHQAAGAAHEMEAHNALNDVRSMAAALRQLARCGRMKESWLAENSSIGRFSSPL
jgi:inhibitor of KinA sporulation pathway (predicted exonuclease)